MATNSKWIIDPSHSEVQFKVKHLGIVNVPGTFKVFGGELESSDDSFSNASVSVKIDVESIDTNNGERDKHLRSEIFFDAVNYPVIAFDGELQQADDDYILAGDLTIHGVTLPVELEAELIGTGKGRFGDDRAGFEANGKINRKDFGLTFNSVTDSGNLLLGEEVKLHFNIELIKK